MNGNGIVDEGECYPIGTNYYWRSPVCPHCGRSEKLHVGKSSAGWCFNLHVYPEKGINGLEDWKERFFGKEDSELVDEYGCVVTPEEMLEQITERSWPSPATEEDGFTQSGPNNLYRHKVDGQFCIGHGEGTWDLCVGEFT